VLLTVAKGWQSHQLEENAAKVAKLAKEMHERVGVVVNHVVKMGDALCTVLTTYDAMVGSMETRLLVTMRNFKDLGVVQENEPMKNIAAIGKSPREIKAPEATFEGLPFGEIEP
jgi:DNA recombination protein RmuC